MSKDLKWHESAVRVMNDFVVKMWRSGYPVSWRADAIMASTLKYEDMVKEDRDVTRYLFRPKDFMAEERKLAKQKKSRLWHKSGSEEGVTAGDPLIICPTAGELVSKKVKDLCKKFKAEHNIDIKVYEQGGLKIGNISKSDPLSPSTCEKEDCFPVQAGEEVIVGEAARWLEHVAGLSNEKDDNPLLKHCEIQQDGQKVAFKMVCLRSFKTAYLRPVNKGLRIACCNTDICMNSKAEFHQSSIVRVTKILGNSNEE